MTKILKIDDFKTISKHVDESAVPTGKARVERLVSKYKLTFNEKTGAYDCNTDVECWKDLVYDGKLIIKFGKVRGDFNCTGIGLTTLEGAPEEVGGDFLCYDNELITLNGAPVKVGGDFGCGGNNLKSLDNLPKTIDGDIHSDFE